MEFVKFVFALSPIVLVLAGILALRKPAMKVAPVAMVWTIILAFTMFNVQNLPSYGDKEGGDESTMVGLYYSSLPTSYKDVVETGMKVRIGSEEGKIEMIAMVHPEDGDQELELIITMDNPSLSLRDGEYDAELVLESTTPISFLWN